MDNISEAQTDIISMSDAGHLPYSQQVQQHSVSQEPIFVEPNTNRESIQDFDEAVS